MAKQTYTTGQVLTAAQMTALQANDYNQTVSAKVASYTLVAADAGTRITMSNASATTITVNTGLFAAGDTLYITNIGAGACTITAGTATVSTASSLVLAQYDSGVLYFTSAGVAIWQKYDGAAASSGGMTLLSTTSWTTASQTISSISGAYKDLKVVVTDWGSSIADDVNLRLNGTTTTSYQSGGLNLRDSNTGSSTWSTAMSTVIKLTDPTYPFYNLGDNNFMTFTIFDYTNTVSNKVVAFNVKSTNNSSGNPMGVFGQGLYTATPAAINSITLWIPTAGTPTGTIYIYGVS
jgi:hypothetical protein